MNKLQELIRDLCPNGVEYKALGEVGELIRGSGLQKKDFSEAGVGCIHYGQIHTKFGTYTNEVLSFVPEKLADKLTVVHPHDVIVAVTSEDIAACCKAVAWIGDVDIVTGGHCVVIRHSLDSKYLSYCFQTDEFYAQKKRFAAGVKVTEMRTDKLARIRIPVPPIEVQREVVRILDEYTAAHGELVKRLEEEVSLHEQLTAAARNEVLAFNDDVTYKELGEIGSFYGGLTGKTKNDFGSGAHFVSYVNVYSNPSVDLMANDLVEVSVSERQNVVHKGDVLFTISSENREEAGLTSVMTKEPESPWYLNSFCTGWRANDPELLLPDYLKHLLRGPEARRAISRTANGVTRFNISKPKLAKVRIPIPSIEIQRKVVHILDEYVVTYEELLGRLGDELCLREQRLTRLRNQLLSFPEKVA